MRKLKDWKKIVQEQSSLPRHNTPRPSSRPSPPSIEEDSDSESEVKESLEPSSDEDGQPEVSKLCWEGGAALSHFLITKAISASVAGSEWWNSSNPKRDSLPEDPKEWTYRDIL